MSSQTLNELLAGFKLQQKDLDKPCSEAHANRIARRVDNWDELAPFIGLNHQEVDDIKDQYKTIPSRRLASLRKWRQKFGRDATYLKLVEGLIEIDRRDLTEIVLNIVKLLPKPPAQHAQHPQIHVGRWHKILNHKRLAALATAVCSLFFYSNFMSMNTSFNADELKLHQEENTNGLVISKQQYIPPSDLPVISGPFVGREHDVQSITAKLTSSSSTRIINIHGPPAFGKSTLAIHIGYRLLMLGTAVRYIDSLEHRQLFQFAVSYTSAQSALSQQTNLEKFSGHERRDSSAYAYDFLRWAQELQNDTVLILDNCDGILSSHVRDSFISLVNKLPNNKLKLIITSQEKLVLLDGFESWPVTELNAKDSEQLLAKIATKISSKDAIALAESVGGCPLALKVIGMLVNTSGKEFVPNLVKQLHNSPITTLDKVSDKNARFRVVMDTAFSYLDRDLQVTGLYLCLFPGSFDLKAALFVVMPYTESHVEDLVRCSLLEQYAYAGELRFKMHKLIREYLRKQSNLEMYRQHFGRKFRSHYSDFFMNFTKLRNSNKTTEKDEFLFSTEKHNIDFLIESFQSLPWQEYSSDELSALTLAISEKWVPLDTHVLEGFVQRITIKNMNSTVCKVFASYADCVKLYLNILDRIYNSEKCVISCHSNLGCAIMHIHKHITVSISDKAEACDLLSCTSVKHIVLLISEFYGRNFSVSASVNYLCLDLIQANKACSHVTFSAYYLWRAIFLFLLILILADYSIANLTGLYSLTSAMCIKYILLEGIISAIYRCIVIGSTLLIGDTIATIFPEYTFIANQAIVHHLFSPAYLLPSYLSIYTLRLMFRHFDNVLMANDDNNIMSFSVAAYMLFIVVVHIAFDMFFFIILLLLNLN